MIIIINNIKKNEKQNKNNRRLSHYTLLSGPSAECSNDFRIADKYLEVMCPNILLYHSHVLPLKNVNDVIIIFYLFMFHENIFVHWKVSLIIRYNILYIYI